MVKYLTMRIEMGKINYFTVLENCPQHKDAIDANLAADGYIVDKNGDIKPYSKYTYTETDEKDESEVDTDESNSEIYDEQ